MVIAIKGALLETYADGRLGETRGRLSPRVLSQRDRDGEGDGRGGYRDPAMQQYIRYLDESKPPSERFIITVVDSTRLFVKESVVPELQAAIRALMDKHTYTDE